MQLKCLSLWQPWADVIFRTDPHNVMLKPDETRGWSTNVRGRIAIHAAKKPLRDVFSMMSEMRHQMSFAGIREHELAFGFILGVVDIVDCTPAAEAATRREDWQRVWGDYRERGDDGKPRYAFALAHAVRLPHPIPCVGRQGFFNIEV